MKEAHDIRNIKTLEITYIYEWKKHMILVLCVQKASFKRGDGHHTLQHRRVSLRSQKIKTVGEQIPSRDK